MKRNKIIGFSTVAALLLGAGLSSCCFIPEKEEKLTYGKNSVTLGSDTYKLVWNDEFDAGSLDTSAWSKESWAPGKVNKEVQSYSTGAAYAEVGPETADGSDDGSTLKINAISSDGVNWTSARLKTEGKVSLRYGYIEARLRMPKAYDKNGNELLDEDDNLLNNGVWPAFWMMPENALDEEGNPTNGGEYGVWPRSGEIDIMEYSPSTSGQKTYATLHHAASKTDATDTYPSLGGKTFKDPTDWHTYGIMWTSGTLEAFYDGVSLGAVYANSGTSWAKYPFDQDFYIILNLAMGGNLGGAINKDMRKAVYEVDYVRVYQNPTDKQSSLKLNE